MTAMTEAEELRADVKTLQEDVRQLTKRLKRVERHQHSFVLDTLRTIEWTGPNVEVESNSITRMDMVRK